MTNNSVWLSMEENELRQRLYQDMEQYIPSIWTIAYGKDAKKYYEEYLDKLRNEKTTTQPLVKKTS